MINMKSLIRSVLTVLLISAPAMAAQAAEVELYLATEYTIDPNTGLKAPAPLNLSGKADLSYSNNGIVLGFEGRDGKLHNLKIHLDFNNLLDTDPSQRAAAIAILDKLNQMGPAAIGNIITEISKRAKGGNQTLTVMLDSVRSPGFYKTDFDLGQVRMVTSGGENVRLQNLVAASFMPQAQAPTPEPTEKAERPQVNQSQIQTAPKGSNGDMTGAVSAGAKCEITFTTGG